mmetsp:Transcript_29854/g.57377  ORF Transcript_29854/g.57377 Transcript_29854/m.57377 type:complete len:80 (+) Transcript_29854:1586-1825(+)
MHWPLGDWHLIVLQLRGASNLILRETYSPSLKNCVLTVHGWQFFVAQTKIFALCAWKCQTLMHSILVVIDVCARATRRS